MKTGHFLTDVELETAVSLWAKGKDTHAIADHLNVNEAHVFNALREYREKKRKLAS